MATETNGDFRAENDTIAADETAQVADQPEHESTAHEGGREAHESQGFNDESNYAILTPVIFNHANNVVELPAHNGHLAASDIFFTNFECRSPSEHDNTDDSNYERSYENNYGHYDQAYREEYANISNGSNEEDSNPFSEKCRIPLPGDLCGPFQDTRTFVRRRNERERARVRNVNDGFERLRRHLPNAETPEPKDRRLSKVDTLRQAIEYIRHLEDLLASSD